MRDVVCLGCGRQRPYDPEAAHSPDECLFCQDVSWTYLEDAERDPAGIADCIARRRPERERRLTLEGGDLAETLRDLVHAA